jgi:hypothetical protein
MTAMNKIQTRAEARAKYYNCTPQRRTGARFDKPKLLSAAANSYMGRCWLGCSAVL